MKTETFTDPAAFLAALHSKRPKRAKPGGAHLPRPAAGSTRGKVGDWTAGKVDRAYTAGQWQLGYDARQWAYAFRDGEKTEAYQKIDELLVALEAEWL